jgi:hypothetical protein
MALRLLSRQARARTDFEEAWSVFLSRRTPADFQVWRDQEAWTGEKYRRFDRGERRPPVAEHGWKRPFDEPIPLPRGASSSRSRMPAITSRNFRKPSTKPPSGRPQWKR